MSVTASSSSYSTATASAASSATARLVATMAATASPCQQTRSIAIACCGADFSPFRCDEHADPGRDDVGELLPGDDGDDARQSPCRIGVDRDDLRMGMGRAQKHDMRHARQLDVADIVPAPLHQPVEIGPRHRLADIGIRPIEHRKPSRIFRCRVMAGAPARASRRGLDRIDDGLIAGAAAVIAGQMLADLLAVRLRHVCLSKILRRHQHARRAEAALQRIAVAKRGLQIGDLAAVGQSFDGLDRAPCRPAPPASGRSARSRR